MAFASRERGPVGVSVAAPGSDRLAWFFLRVSGALLVVFALGHLFITHYVNIPSETTFDFVSARWANPLWRSFDWILLLAALWHGLIGLRYSVTDWIRPAGWRQVSFALLWVFGLVFTVVGSVTIISFDEAAARDNTGPLAGAFWIADLLGFSLFVFAVGSYLSIVALAVWVYRNLKAGITPVYAGDPGQYAWVLHRLTGIGILFFLLVHIIDIMLIGLGRDVYDESVEFYAHPFLLPMEILLVGAVIYHTLNGLRIIAIDFSSTGVQRQRQYFWWVLIGSVALTIPSGIIIFAKELF